MNDQITIFELFSEDLIKYTIAGALIFSRIMAVQFTSDYFTIGGWKRLVWPCFFLLLPSAIWRMSTTQEYHVINHEYFRMLPDEESMYV